MARSPWNAALEHSLAAATEHRLSASALRLHLALLRYTLGWNRREASLGRRLICELSGLHGRTFERARAELVEAGLVHVEHGANEGQNTRSMYALILPSLAGEDVTPVTDDGGHRKKWKWLVLAGNSGDDKTYQFDDEVSARRFVREAREQGMFAELVA